jgi:hypothetical protein
MKIILGENEKRIKTYHCTNMDNPVAKGYLTVTNKRVIFHATGSTGEFYEDAHIENVSGVATSFGSTTNPLKIVLGIIMLVTTLVLFFAVGRFDNSPVYIVAALVSGIIATLLLFTSRNQYFYLNIMSNSGASAINVRCDSNNISKFGNFAGVFLAKTAKPTNATYLMTSELGSLIMDIKELGDKVFEKYPVQELNIHLKTPEICRYVARHF